VRRVLGDFATNHAKEVTTAEIGMQAQCLAQSTLVLPMAYGTSRALTPTSAFTKAAQKLDVSTDSSTGYSNGARHLGMESPPSGVWSYWNEEQRGDRHGGGTLLPSENHFATNLDEEESTEATAPVAFVTLTHKTANAALYQDNKCNSVDAASSGKDDIPAKPSGNGSYGDEASPRKGSVLGEGVTLLISPLPEPVAATTQPLASYSVTATSAHGVDANAPWPTVQGADNVFVPSRPLLFVFGNALHATAAHIAHDGDETHMVPADAAAMTRYDVQLLTVADGHYSGCLLRKVHCAWQRILVATCFLESMEKHTAFAVQRDWCIFEELGLSVKSVFGIQVSALVDVEAEKCVNAQIEVALKMGMVATLGVESLRKDLMDELKCAAPQYRRKLLDRWAEVLAKVS
jgi:hypothetical protein